MKVTIVTQNAIRVSDYNGEYPKEILHQKQTYVFGTMIDKSTAVYYLESWLF